MRDEDKKIKQEHSGSGDNVVEKNIEARSVSVLGDNSGTVINGDGNRVYIQENQVLRNETERENDKIGFYERIFKLFKLHGIKKEMIPLLLQEQFNVTFHDVLSNKENFQRKVTKEMIDFLAQNFGVDKQWLYGNSINLYKNEYTGFYKNVENFGDYIDKQKDQIDMLYILTESIPDKKNDTKSNSNYMVIIVQYLKFHYPENNETIYSYEIFYEDCRWGYQKCRYNFKSFLLYLSMKHKIGFTFYRGYTVPHVIDKYMEFNMGEIDFKTLMSGSSMWYPEDYIIADKESVQAKETDELEEILKAIKQDEWSWF